MTRQLDVHDGSGSRPATRKRHPWRKLVVTLLVIVALLVVADFGLATAAEYEVSTKLRDQLGLHNDPAVTIHGFPFTTQALSSDYDHVTVDADGVNLKSFRDLRIHAELYDVNVKLSDVLGGSLRDIPIDRVTGRVTIKQEDISQLLGANPVGHRLHLSNLAINPATLSQVLSDSDQDGSGGQDESDRHKGVGQDGAGSDSDSQDGYRTRAGVELSADMDIAGEKTTVTAYGLINLSHGKIDIAPKRLALRNDKVTSSLPSALQDQLLRSFAITLDPGDLPFDIGALGVAVAPGSISMKGEADNVDVPLG